MAAFLTLSSINLRANKSLSKETSVKERISIEEYDKAYEDLVIRINEARAREAAIENPVEKDFTSLRKVLETDIDSLYKTFTREEKLTFWRAIVKEIKVNEDKTIELVFF